VKTWVRQRKETYDALGFAVMKQSSFEIIKVVPNITHGLSP
jgi:hypothetical protein